MSISLQLDGAALTQTYNEALCSSLECATCPKKLKYKCFAIIYLYTNNGFSYLFLVLWYVRVIGGLKE